MIMIIIIIMAGITWGNNYHGGYYSADTKICNSKYYQYDKLPAKDCMASIKDIVGERPIPSVPYINYADIAQWGDVAQCRLQGLINLGLSRKDCMVRIQSAIQEHGYIVQYPLRPGRSKPLPTPHPDMLWVYYPVRCAGINSSVKCEWICNIRFLVWFPVSVMRPSCFFKQYAKSLPRDYREETIPESAPEGGIVYKNDSPFLDRYCAVIHDPLDTINNKKK